MEAAIVGYSGHALVVLDTLLSLNYHITGYCEELEKKKNPFKLKYLGNEAALSVLNLLANIDVFLGVGDNRLRAEIYNHLMLNKINCPSAIHQKASVSFFAKVGNGTLVMPSAVINSLASIGEAVICNTSCVIEHECTVGNYVHIAPGAVLAGNVTIGEGTFVGANAVIKQGTIIGKNVVIGAGAVVLENIGDGLTVYGNPARKK